MRNRFSKRHGGLLFIVLLSLGLSGCGAISDADRRAAASNADKHEVLIAAVWPFERNNDLFSEGLDLAVEEINAEGGVLGRKLRIDKYDDHSSVTDGLRIAQQLAENPRVAAVIGHRNSYISVPASSIYERAGLLMMSPASTAPELTGRSGSRLIFRSISSDIALAQELAQYAYQHNNRRMVILYDDNAYGKGLAKSFERFAQDRGIAIVDRVGDYSDLAKLRELKYKWEQLAYDGIFLAQSNLTAAQTVLDLREAKADVPLFGGNAVDSVEFRKMTGLAGEGILAGSYFSAESSRAAAKRFVDAYRARYRSEPSQYAALGYDAVRLLAQAMTQARSAAPARVAEALRAVQWEGAVGKHSFSDNGDDSSDLVVIKQLQKGVYRTIQE